MIKTPKSQFTMTSPEAQNVVMDWVEATEEFHRRYFQVNEVINNLCPGKRTRANVMAMDKARQAKLKNFLHVRQKMTDVLVTLLGDMGNGKPLRNQIPSKPGQLVAHTRLLRDFTREIDTELSRVIVAYA